MRGWLALGALLSILAAYGAGRYQGWHGGAASEVARQANEIEALRAKLEKVQSVTYMQAANLEKQRNEVATLTLALEDEARVDVDGCRKPSPNSLRRLRTRFALSP